MTRSVVVTDNSSGAEMALYVQGFREGLLSGVAPTVVLGVGSTLGSIAGTFSMTPENAQILGEYFRQQAEYATTQDEEK